MDRKVDHDAVFHVCGAVSVIFLIPLLFLSHNHFQVEELINTDLSDKFKIIVSVSIAVAFPLSVDLLVDAVSGKGRNLKQLIPRIAICGSLFSTAVLHLFFSVERGNYFVSWVILNMQVVVCTSVALQQTQVRIRLTTQANSYFVLFCWNIGTIVMCYAGKNSKAVLSGGAMRMIAFALTFYQVCKHLKIVARGHFSHDIHAKWQQVAFEVLILGVLSATIVVSAITWRESPWLISPAALVMLSYVTNVFLVLMSLIITNEHRHDLAKAKLKLGVKRMFVRYVSHEVRTPLSSCMMGIAYMKEAIKHPTAACIKEIAGILDEVSEGCSTAIDFMNNLLMYEKIDTMELPLFLKRDDLSVVCAEVVNSFRMTARQLEVTLSLDIHESLMIEAADDESNDDAAQEPFRAMAEIDGPKIVVVLRNLVSNALKFTPQHGQVSLKIIPVKITRETSVYLSRAPVEEPSLPADTTHFRVIVSDTGRGMSQEELQQLFTKIVQFSPNESQKGGGSGIGLFLSHQIIRDHKLEIQVYSAGVADVGTQFYIDFPYKQSPQMIHQRATVETTQATTFDDGPDPSLWLSIYSYFVGGDGKKVNADREKKAEHSEGKEGDMTEPRGDSKKGTPRDPSEEQMDSRRSSLSSLPSSAVSVSKKDEPPPVLRDSSQYLSRSGSTVELKALNELSIMIVDDSSLNRKMLVRTLMQNHVGATFKHLVDGLDLLIEFGVSGEITSDELSVTLDSSHDDCWGDSVRVFPNTLVNDKKYDVIVLDDNMVRMNGSVAVRKLRACGYKGLVVGLTGSAMEQDLASFCKAGVNVALPKPFVVRDFIEILKKRQFVLEK